MAVALAAAVTLLTATGCTAASATGPGTSDPTIVVSAVPATGATGLYIALDRGLFSQAGLSVTRDTTLTVGVSHSTFEEWWQPFTFGVGPAGAYVASLDEDHRAALRERCRAMLSLPIHISATAWAVTACR